MKIDGYDIFEEPDKAKRLIGYLPEQPPLYMNETPAEYLRFVGEAKGLRGAELYKQIGDLTILKMMVRYIRLLIFKKENIS